MLDVHPPHTATHTWRDFFIHIATIVVGLLIAVGLEQTVEALHHRHQRRELLESLESDTKVCAEDGRIRANIEKLHADWLLDREQRINDALWRGRSPVGLPAEPKTTIAEVLSYTHFEAAKASGVLQLLSTEDLDAYSDVNLDVGLAAEVLKSMTAARDKRRAFEVRFLDASFAQLDLSKASAAELREYLSLLFAERSDAIGERLEADVTTGAAESVLQGERGIRKLQQAEIDKVTKDMGTTVPYTLPTARPHDRQ